MEVTDFRQLVFKFFGSPRPEVKYKGQAKGSMYKVKLPLKNGREQNGGQAEGVKYASKRKAVSTK